MTATSSAHAWWSGDLATGAGTTKVASLDIEEMPITWTARAEGGASTTTPEELLAAAHASCFCMELSNQLGKNGTPPERLDVDVAVTFVPSKGITTSVITVVGNVAGVDAKQFEALAAKAKAECPVSKALASVEISLASATLV
jgi:osmotically inducible protein OsmC